VVGRGRQVDRWLACKWVLQHPALPSMPHQKQALLVVLVGEGVLIRLPRLAPDHGVRKDALLPVKGPADRPLVLLRQALQQPAAERLAGVAVAVARCSTPRMRVRGKAAEQRVALDIGHDKPAACCLCEP
jgi:hypothetical protein